MIISIFSQKGGVGKSTTATSLAAALVLLGKKVLVCDMDPQANSTVNLGQDDESLETTIYDLLKMDKLNKDIVESYIIETRYDNLSLLPSDIWLSDAEIVLANAMNRERKLEKVLNFVKDDFDFVLIDVLPSLSLLAVNALVASDRIIVPLTPGYFSAKAVKHLLKTLDRIQENLKPELDILRILVTKYDARKKDLNDGLPQKIKNYKFFNTKIRVDAQVEYAQEAMQPVVFYDEKSRASQDYLAIAREVIEYVSEEK